MKNENKIGLPDGLGAGGKCLSGFSMDDVKVHYNSDRLAGLEASAYASGTDIGIVSGQEKHLEHELRHVVQQRQGQIRPQAEIENELKPTEHS